MSNRRGLVGKELKPAPQGVKAAPGKPAMGQGAPGPLVSKVPIGKKDPKEQKDPKPGTAASSQNTLTGGQVSERLKVSEDAVRDWLKKSLLKGTMASIQSYELEKFKAGFPGEIQRAQKHKLQLAPAAPAPPEESASKKPPAKKAEKPAKKEGESKFVGFITTIINAVQQGLQRFTKGPKPKKNTEPYDKLPGTTPGSGAVPFLPSVSKTDRSKSLDTIVTSRPAVPPQARSAPQVPAPAEEAESPVPGDMIFDEDEPMMRPYSPQPSPYHETDFPTEPSAPPRSGEPVEPPAPPASLPIKPIDLSSSPTATDSRLQLEPTSTAPTPPARPSLGSRPGLRRDALELAQRVSEGAKMEPPAKPTRLQTPGARREPVSLVTPKQPTEVPPAPAEPTPLGSPTISAEAQLAQTTSDWLSGTSFAGTREAVDTPPPLQSSPSLRRQNPQNPVEAPPFQERPAFLEAKSRGAELEALQKELEEEKHRRSLAEGRLSQAAKDLDAVRNELYSAEARAGRQAQELTEQLQVSQVKLRDSEAQLQASQAQLQASLQNQSQAQVGQSEIESLRAQLESSQAQLQSARSHLQGGQLAQSELQATRAQLQSSLAQVEQLTNQLRDQEQSFQARLSQVSSEQVRGLEREYRALEGQLVSSRQALEALQAEHQQVCRQASLEKSRLSEAEHRLAQVEQDSRGSQQQLHLLQEKLRCAEESLGAAERQLLATQRENLVLQRERQEVDRQWQQKLEDSLEQQQAHFAAQEDQLRQLLAQRDKEIRELQKKAAHQGPSAEEHNAARAELEETRAKLDESAKKVKTLEQKHSTQIQRWEKELQAAGNWVGKLTEAVQLKDKRINELESLVSQNQARTRSQEDNQLTAQLMAARVELTSLKRHFETTQKSLLSAEQELDELRQERARLQGELQAKSSQLPTADSGQPSVQQELKHNQELVKQLESEVVATIVKLAAVEREKLELEARLREFSGE